MLKLWAIAVAGVFFFFQAVAAVADDQPWVLRTYWKCESGTQDPSLEYFKSKDRLLAEIESTRKKYSQGGILQYAPCKPAKFSYWYQTGVTAGTVPKDATTVDAFPAPASVTPKPGMAEKAKSNGNRKWAMWLEQFKEGQWSEVPNRRSEYLESEGVTEDGFKKKLELYVTAVESLNNKTIREETEQQQKGQAVKPIRYRVKWNSSDGAVPNGTLPNRSAAGEYQWGNSSNYDGYTRLVLRDDGSVTLRVTGQGTYHDEWKGKWTTTKEGWIELKDGVHVSGSKAEKNCFGGFVAWKLEGTSLTPVYLAPSDPNDKGKPLKGWRVLQKK